MVTFLNPQIFLLLPIVIVIIYLMKRRNLHIAALLHRIYTKNFIKKTNFHKIAVIRIILMALIFIFILLGFSKAEYITAVDEDINKKNIIFMLDISRSMYVVDEGEQKSRIEKAVAFLSTLIKDDPNNRYMLVGFSDTLVEILPFISDTDSILTALQGIQNYKFTTGSTDFTKVVESFEYFIQRQKETMDLDNIHVLFISDGESHTTTSDNVVLKLVQGIDSMQIVSVGKKIGGVIEIDGKELVDNIGLVVVSVPNIQILEAMASSARTKLINLEEYNDDFFSLAYKKPRENAKDITWIARAIAAILLFGYILVLLI